MSCRQSKVSDEVEARVAGQRLAARVVEGDVRGARRGAVLLGALERVARELVAVELGLRERLRELEQRDAARRSRRPRPCAPDSSFAFTPSRLGIASGTRNVRYQGAKPRSMPRAPSGPNAS